jgi:hypothetical protein
VTLLTALSLAKVVQRDMSLLIPRPKDPGRDIEISETAAGTRCLGLSRGRFSVRKPKYQAVDLI